MVISVKITRLVDVEPSQDRRISKGKTKIRRSAVDQTTVYETRFKQNDDYLNGALLALSTLCLDLNREAITYTVSVSDLGSDSLTTQLDLTTTVSFRNPLELSEFLPSTVPNFTFQQINTFDPTRMEKKYGVFTLQEKNLNSLEPLFLLSTFLDDLYVQGYIDLMREFKMNDRDYVYGPAFDHHKRLYHIGDTNLVYYGQGMWPRTQPSLLHIYQGVTSIVPDVDLASLLYEPIDVVDITDTDFPQSPLLNPKVDQASIEDHYWYNDDDPKEKEDNPTDPNNGPIGDMRDD